MRVGIGFDLHRLADGRPLFLGGVRFDYPRGPIAHSDGDVLVHAICDALLGAAGLGDLGEHFPDTDPRWKGASGATLLSHVLDMVEGAGLAVEHVDTVVIAEAPRIAPRRAEVQRSLANLLRVGVERVNVKAATVEGVGAVGAGDAIAAQAVALLAPRPDEDVEVDQ